MQNAAVFSEQEYCAQASIKLQSAPLTTANIFQFLVETFLNSSQQRIVGISSSAVLAAEKYWIISMFCSVVVELLELILIWNICPQINISDMICSHLQTYNLMALAFKDEAVTCLEMWRILLKEVGYSEVYGRN